MKKKKKALLKAETFKWNKDRKSIHYTMKHQIECYLTKVVKGDIEFLYVDEHRSFRNSDHLFIAWDTQSQKSKVKEVYSMRGQREPYMTSV